MAKSMYTRRSMDLIMDQIHGRTEESKTEDMITKMKKESSLFVPWDFQTVAIDRAREFVQNDLYRFVLTLPTGSGKTVIASHILYNAAIRGIRAWFVADRQVLISQTSDYLKKIGLPHGVIQGSIEATKDHMIHVVSAQTIAKRKVVLTQYDVIPQLVIVDECHTKYKAVLDMMQASRMLNDKKIFIGLSASPFTDGLGTYYDGGVISPVTTLELTEKGYLAPFKVKHCSLIDMMGAKVNTGTGEWLASEVEGRAIQVYGDTIREYKQHTGNEFGEDVKTIAFGATVNHCHSIAKVFNDAGIPAAVVSYKDGNSKRDLENRKGLIKTFKNTPMRASETENGKYEVGKHIAVLVSVDVLGKGFDDPNILCILTQRPFKNSFAQVIQQLGRALRSADNKDFALWLDFSGNYDRFYRLLWSFFINGCHTLDHQNVNWNQKKTKLCKVCGYINPIHREICVSCKTPFPKKPVRIEEYDAELKEATGSADTEKVEGIKQIVKLTLTPQEKEERDLLSTILDEDELGIEEESIEERDSVKHDSERVWNTISSLALARTYKNVKNPNETYRKQRKWAQVMYEHVLKSLVIEKRFTDTWRLEPMFISEQLETDIKNIISEHTKSLIERARNVRETEDMVSMSEDEAPPTIH